MTQKELSVEDTKKKESLGYRILLKIAAAVGIGWGVMLIFVRIAGIALALIAAPIVGFAVLLLLPDAPTVVHVAGFILTPLLIWAATELFIWYYNSPIDAWIHS